MDTSQTPRVEPTAQPKGRDYQRVRETLGGKPGRSRDALMRGFVDALWESVKDCGVSWAGFYLKTDGADEMTLGPRRDKPACSPIGLHGACGRTWRTGRTLIVRDVAALGAGYIACDPRDRSELVVPLFDDRGACYAVLDLDSYEVGAFGEGDARALQRLLVESELSAPPADQTIETV